MTVHRDIVAIGTSAGGFQALRFLAGALPDAFPASVLVTIHLSHHFRSSLDHILSAAGPLPATFAKDGEPLEPGHIYLAPPERHLIVDNRRLTLGSGPRENSARPAIDAMMRSAAVCCGHRAIGVVLTGTLADGAAGLAALHECGGLTVVQDPADAAFPEMPATALSRLHPDHVATLERVPSLLEQLVQEPAGRPAPAPAGLTYEVEVAKGQRQDMATMDHIGRRSAHTCPDCGGNMWEMDGETSLRFRCHVGHAHGAESLNVGLDEGVRRALASALRALEERKALAGRLHREAVNRGSAHSAEHWMSELQDIDREAQTIRQTIERVGNIAAGPDQLRAAG